MSLQSSHLDGALAPLLSTARVRGLLWDSGKKESRAGSIPTLCLLQGLCVVNVCSCLYMCVHVCANKRKKPRGIFSARQKFQQL